MLSLLFLQKIITKRNFIFNSNFIKLFKEIFGHTANSLLNNELKKLYKYGLLKVGS